jgi:hypothetical protein
MTSESELNKWITESRQHRQQLKLVLAAFIGLALLVGLSSHKVAGVMLFVAATIAVSGFWILAGHIADWEGQLARRKAR